MTRILVVEGEAITAQNIARKLKRAGYAVVAVEASGDDALETAKQ